MDGRRQRWGVWAAASAGLFVLLAVGDATAACRPRYFPAAQFGRLPILTDPDVVRARIPGASHQCHGHWTDEVGCDVIDRGGVTYSIGHGILFRKSLRLAPDAAGPMGLRVGDDVKTVRRKIAPFHLPELTQGEVDGETLISVETCTTTRTGDPYGLTFVFNGAGGLTRIEEEVSTPYD